MKYLVFMMLFLSLFSCQNETKQSHQKKEISTIKKSSEASQIAVNPINKTGISEPEEQIIIFVCDDGFDKSVLAASYFNEKLKDKQLAYKAISRAAKNSQQPINNIPTDVLIEILSTGLSLQSTDVITLTKTEMHAAHKIIYLDEAPVSINYKQKSIFWEGIPPLKAGVDKTLTAIKEKVDKLVKEIGC